MLFGKFALLVGGGCPCRESGYGGGAQSEDGDGTENILAVLVSDTVSVLVQLIHSALF